MMNFFLSSLIFCYSKILQVLPIRKDFGGSLCIYYNKRFLVLFTIKYRLAIKIPDRKHVNPTPDNINPHYICKSQN